MPVTNAKEWKGRGGVELELPSGNVCLARKVGITTFIRKGLIPNSLLGMVQKAQQGRGLDRDEILGDDQRLRDLVEMYDRIVVDVVVQPRVLAAPPEGVAREEDALYVDDVDDEDKQFVANWAMGGVRDLESFREQQTRGVEVGSALQNVEVQA